MEDSFSKTSKEAILQNQSSSSGDRTKLQLTFYLFIFFSLIFASIICVFNVLNHHAYSQLLTHNPKNATQSVCTFTSDPDFCYDVVFVSSAIPDGIDPTHIFHISLLSSLGNLSELVDLPKSMISGLESETRFVLRECEFMFVFAQSQLNESVARLYMENSEYGKMLGVDKLVWDLQSFISQAQGQVSTVLPAWVAQLVTGVKFGRRDQGSSLTSGSVGATSQSEGGFLCAVSKGLASVFS